MRLGSLASGSETRRRDGGSADVPSHFSLAAAARAELVSLGHARTQLSPEFARAGVPAPDVPELADRRASQVRSVCTRDTPPSYMDE